MKKEKIAVAMSGGVDSSVAAALLKEQGREVVGITMCLNLPDPVSGRPACCGAQGISDAKRTCDHLGIPHYVLNFGKEMERTVIADFIREYAGGKTPNPCVRCNELLKFGVLLDKVNGLGLNLLATGHYARILKRRGVFYLKKARDRLKDQSYFLYRMTQEKLARVIFPLGERTKQEVREIARKLRLPVAEKRESQEICFIPDDYRRFLELRGTGSAAGEIVDKRGVVLGRHRGIAYYTVGQRSGLGIARGYPLYVLEVDAARNRIVVGERAELVRREFTVGSCVFPSGLPAKKTFMCRIRHLSREAKARIRIEGGRISACFEEPQFAITPGQSAVFYDGEIVRCGGIIEKTAG